jgi:hypothetical protein
MKNKIAVNARAILLFSLAGLWVSFLPHNAMAGQVANPSPGKVYVLLWFDTEDYILPQSDDAAKRLAVFLTQQGIRATFKVVGEKARVLERRGRRDVIGAIAQHEIGYHSNLHSQHPTPAEYSSLLNWPDGANEFNRRERPGFDDVKRIFGQTPTCYGQPGGSWTPHSFPALKKWGVKVYLDEAPHVGLNGKPFWYGGLLNVANTREGAKLRPVGEDGWSNVKDAQARFQEFYLRMTSRKEGGVISLFFHPCEFVHKEFWDGVNFADGANPPPSEWKLPATKSPEESEKAFKFFEELVLAMKSFPQVEFITASQALQLFRDSAQRRSFEPSALAPIAERVDSEVSFQVHDDYNLSASEIFLLLNKYVAGVIEKAPHAIVLDGTPNGPSSPFEWAATAGVEGGTATNPKSLESPIEVPWSQFSRTVLDVNEALQKSDQIPSAVWLGSRPVPPESYLVALARVTTRFLVRAEPPESVTIPSARLAAAQYVAEDAPELWNWVIFPRGFRAPRLMTQAKLQAWTLKPARSVYPAR